MMQQFKNVKGFSLIEVMIASLVSGIVVMAGYAMYRSHMRSYLTQQQIGDMQQNIRAVMYFMATDMRMAGFGLWGSPTEYGVSNPRSDTVTIKMDLNNDQDTADAGEQIVYALAGGNLTRNGEVLARNIEVLDFVYLTTDEDGDGRGDVLPVDAGTGVVSEPDRIRSVEITVIARAGDRELAMRQELDDEKTYFNQQGILILDKSGANKDKLRRRLYSSAVMCRNMGLSGI